jgi:hypothetical protein
MKQNRVGFSNFYRLNSSGRPLPGSSLDADKKRSVNDKYLKTRYSMKQTVSVFRISIV